MGVKLCNLVANLYLCVATMKVNLDTIGITASIICAIHCAILPLFVTSLPVFGSNIVENIWFELCMVAIAFIVGASSLYHGFKKHRRSFLPLIVFSLGFGFLILKLFFIEYEKWLLIPAVFGIVFAHIINYRSCHHYAHYGSSNH